MDELVKLVAKKTGLPEDKAKVAVETVVGFLKQKLPAPVASQIDGVLGSSPPADVAKEISNLFG